MNFKQLLFEEEELNTPEKLKTAIKNGRVPGVKPGDLDRLNLDYLNYMVNKFRDFPSIHRNAAIKLATKRCLLNKKTIIVDAYYAYFNNRNKQEAKTTYKQLFTDFEEGKISDKAFEDKIKELFKDKVKGKEEANKLYEDDNYLVVIPKTFAASCKYGEGTKWCTAGSEKMFKQYNQQSPLIIIINKKLDSRSDPLAKVQLHSKTNSAMDAQDRRIKLIDYLDKLPSKIQEVLKKNDFNRWSIVLERASEVGDTEKAKEALKNGADVHVNNDKILKYASVYGHTEVVKLLLDVGADVHADDDYVLRIASFYGHTEVVKLLLAAGANVHAKDDEALKLASMKGHIEVVKLLLDAGANVHANGDEALKHASYNRRTEVVKLLKQHMKKVKK